MYYMPGIFALLVMAAGWFYIFYSSAAQRLSAIEDMRLNTMRVRLRRVNGLVMMLLAVSFYAACYTAVEPRSVSWLFVSIVVLLAVMITMALVDLQLTRRLREQRRNQKP